MIRILNAEPDGYCETARRILRSLGDLREQRLSRDELLLQIADFDVLIVRLGVRVDREIMERGTRLRVVVSATTGLDHIDVGFAKKRSIEVLSLNGEADFLEKSRK